MRQVYILQLWDFLSPHPFYLCRHFSTQMRDDAKDAAKLYALIELSKHQMPLRYDWARGFCFIRPRNRQPHQNAFLYLTTDVESRGNEKASAEGKKTIEGKYIAQHVKALETLGTLSETEIHARLALQYQQWIIDEFQRVRNENQDTTVDSQEGDWESDLAQLIHSDDLPEV